MIKINRACLPKNTKMDQKKVQALKSIKQSINKGEKPSIKKLWTKDKDPEVKEFLHNSQYGKCCYCERERGPIEMDIEHFRPKSEVKENKNHQGYWWLAYEWDNLLLACKKCNNQKGTKFPLKQESRRAFKPQDDLTKEDPFLINPLIENPEDFIEYDIKDPIMIKAKGKNERGERTVNELTGINALEVLKERAYQYKKWNEFHEVLLLLPEELKNEQMAYIKKAKKARISPQRSFAGFFRFLFSCLE